MRVNRKSESTCLFCLFSDKTKFCFLFISVVSTSVSLYPLFSQTCFRSVQSKNACTPSKCACVRVHASIRVYVHACTRVIFQWKRFSGKGACDILVACVSACIFACARFSACADSD